jgi:hypothetical protein
MIRSIGLHTYEIDDVDVAIAEIKGGLKDFSLLENTIGIIMCDPEYVESGIYGALCEALPISDSPAFDNCLTLYKGESFPAKMSFVLLAGNVNPRFLISTLQDDDKMPFSGEITKSKEISSTR